LVPIFFFIQFVEIPAFVFLGIWVLFQFLNAAGSSAQAGGIAWWAHIGGFIFGVVFLKLFEFFPQVGADKRFRSLTHKRTTPRIQVIHPAPTGEDLDTREAISITRREAMLGTRKLINLAQGFRKKTFWLTIPPGVTEGSSLRLKGLGQQRPDGVSGDLYLKVFIRD
jgi:hypothetical protein